MAGPDAVPIVFVSAHAGRGGAEGYMERVIRGLPRDWRAGAVFLGDGPAVQRLHALGVDVRVLRRRDGWHVISSLPQLRRTILDLQPKLVHANGLNAAFATALALSFRRIPIVWLKVDFTGEGWLSNLAAMRCRAVICISRAVTSGFWRPLRTRVRVVHCGIPDYDISRDEARGLLLQRTGWPSDSEIVVVSGRIGPSKGQAELIQAAPAIAGARPNARFLLLGSEDPFHPGYRSELATRAAALGLEDRVRICDVSHDGHDPAIEAVRVVAGSDVVAMPSMREGPYGWQEGFGLVGAEAFRVGTPVVAYRHGSLPEVVGDCARMVNEGDHASLAAEIVELLGAPLTRERMSACGRRIADERYRLDRAVELMKSCYLEAARS